MKTVIALGGNALGNDVDSQKKNIETALIKLIPILIKNKVVITHGNGPQVGMIKKVFDDASIKMPLSESTAMSEGYIGFHIVDILREILKKNNINKKVVAIISEVGVSKKDKAFTNPTKPIGKFYTKEEALNLSKKEKAVYKEDSGRGYRKFVASPEPLDIVEKDVVKLLLNKNYIVVTIGGGGIPYFVDSKETCEAVIDKDKASAKLAEIIDAKELIIITSVDNVQINFGTDKAKKLYNITISEVEKHLSNNEFAEGSMKPKIEAALSFLKSKKAKRTIITSLNNINNLEQSTIIKR